KERIATEAQQCQRPGQLGELLRREGLHSSTLARWRRELQENELTSKKSNGKESLAQENRRLKRDNERLTEKLRQAELIIDVQKKVSEMMQTRSPGKTD
ncbi:transposase, partial [Bacillus mycoides]|uniref:transposase n=1 Tax=Bacillus mycoides TaxID=1405 RepID=UPI003D647881